MWLALVPDGALFGLSQVVTAVHVVTSLASVPVLAVGALRHARGMLPILRGWVRRIPALALLLLLVATTASGAAALTRGQGTPIARAHLVCAAALLVPLMVHLLQGPRRRVAVRTVLGAAIGAAGLCVFGRLTPSGPPPAPSFRYATRPAELYDPAYWCGECHEAIHAEWHRSAHARTLGIPRVKSELRQHEHLTQLDLAAFGEIARSPDDPRQGRIDGAFAFEACTACHAPASFYGDDPRTITESDPPARDGVTCSFCHTLRGVRAAGDVARIVEQAGSHPRVGPMIEQMPLYVSAPETVRRYVGQASPNAALRWIGNALIRWRPAVHREDYHASFLDRSEACSACHGAAGNAKDLPVRSFADWKASPYAAPNSEPAVDCQDCHMVREPTGRHAVEPGALVDWGPTRPQRRSHQFLGGNVSASIAFRDAATAEREHAFAAQGVSVRVRGDRDEGGRAVRVSTTIRNDGAGHLFPTVDSNLRYAWVSLTVVDAQGRTLARTDPPAPEALERSDLVLFRCTSGDFMTRCDSAVPPRSERTVRVVLPIEGDPARVVAEVHEAFDPAPIAAANAPVE
jgi:hypothetical protein